jgi:hypothetical protein
VTIVDADKISDEAAAAVAEVSQTVNGALRVKLHDKQPSLTCCFFHSSADIGLSLMPRFTTPTVPARVAVPLALVRSAVLPLHRSCSIKPFFSNCLTMPE